MPPVTPAELVAAVAARYGQQPWHSRDEVIAWLATPDGQGIHPLLAAFLAEQADLARRHP
jgi:hypothetical protein